MSWLTRRLQESEQESDMSWLTKRLRERALTVNLWTVDGDTLQYIVVCDRSCPDRDWSERMKSIIYNYSGIYNGCAKTETHTITHIQIVGDTIYCKTTDNIVYRLLMSNHITKRFSDESKHMAFATVCKKITV